MESSGESFLRQLSVGSSPSCYHNTSSSSARGSKRWGVSSSSSKKKSSSSEVEDGGMRGMGMGMKKRVMVVIEHSTRAKHAMMWALTHIANKGDLLTLLHVVPPPSSHHHHHQHSREQDYAPNLANSLGSLCKACKPEVNDANYFLLHCSIFPSLEVSFLEKDGYLLKGLAPYPRSTYFPFMAVCSAHFLCIVISEELPFLHLDLLI